MRYFSPSLTELPYIEMMFQRVVDFTEPNYQAIGSFLVQILTFDTGDFFKQAHPQMPVEMKSGSPNQDKSVGDSSTLKPVLSDFLDSH